MAAGSKLVLTFQAADQDINLTYNYCKSDVEPAKVKALITGIITNGSIFATVPLAAKNAKVVTVTETNYDLDNE